MRLEAVFSNNEPLGEPNMTNNHRLVSILITVFVLGIGLAAAGCGGRVTGPSTTATDSSEAPTLKGDEKVEHDDQDRDRGQARRPPTGGGVDGRMDGRTDQ